MGKKKEKGTGNNRRDFLKLAAISAPAVAVAVASGTAAQEAVELESTGSGLRDTAHTRAYFETARF